MFSFVGQASKTDLVGDFMHTYTRTVASSFPLCPNCSKHVAYYPGWLFVLVSVMVFWLFWAWSGASAFFTGSFFWFWWFWISPFFLLAWFASFFLPARKALKHVMPSCTGNKEPPVKLKIGVPPFEKWQSVGFSSWTYASQFAQGNGIKRERITATNE